MEASSPRISILLPAYNAAATLPACLRSIVRQTEPRWECVLIDDGSSDDTRRVALEHAARDPRIRVTPIAHGGLVRALEAGISLCRGRYVARMDADDLMHRERLEAQADLLDARPGLDAVGCHVRLFPRAGLAQGRRAYERWLNGIDSPRRVLEEAFVECPIAHPTLMIRRERLEAMRYRDMGWPEDFDLVLRLLGEGRSIGVVPRRLLSWRDGPGRLSRTGEAYRLERFTGCKAAFLAGGLLREVDRYVLWGHGPTGRALRRALQAHGKEVSHIVEVHPRRIGNVIGGAPVVSHEALLELPRLPLVVSVAGEGPRGLIREALAGMGFEEVRDFVCAA